jgi:hypothetical protein
MNTRSAQQVTIAGQALSLSDEIAHTLIVEVYRMEQSHSYSKRC